MQAIARYLLFLWLCCSGTLALRPEDAGAALEVGEREGSDVASTHTPLPKHTVARDNTKKNPAYPDKALVPDDKVFWSTAWPAYNPVDWSSPIVAAAPVWADPLTLSATASQWNDESHRTFCTCKEGMTETSTACWGANLLKEKDGSSWNIPHNGLTPLNPMGRTGMTGRGLLGKWGANHAADPMVTRLNAGDLEIVLIKRSDTGNMAIPGGMVEAGESVSATLAKEFNEEALRGNQPTGMTTETWNAQIQAIELSVQSLWQHGTVIYSGYVDDPRNTDNAWMETVAYHFHDANNVLSAVHLKAGDDAVGVGWRKVKDVVADSFGMFASHKNMIKEMYMKYCEKHLSNSECHAYMK